MASSHHRQISSPDQGTTIMVGGTVLSRVLGFVRDMLLAHLLGPAADLFLVAFRIPNFFRRLVAEGSLGLACATAFSHTAAKQGMQAALTLGRDIFLSCLIFALPLTLVLVLAAKPLVFLMAPGLSDNPEVLQRTTLLFQYCIPYLPLSALAAIGFSMRTSQGDFIPQAFAATVFNLCLLAAGLVALYTASTSRTIENILCIGVSCAGVAQFALLARRLPGTPPDTSKGAVHSFITRSSTILHGLPHALKNTAAHTVLKRIPSTAFGASVHQLQVLVGVILASFLASGSISALYFAERLFELPLGLAGVAISVVAAPRLAAFAAQEDKENFNTALAQGIGISLFLSLPAAAGLAGLAVPVSWLFFGHGAYGTEGALLTAACLAAYAPGLPAMCMARPLLAALAAIGETRSAALAACKSLLVVVLVGLLTRKMGPLGIALGIAAASWFHVFLLLRILAGRGYPSPLAQHGKRLGIYCAMAMVLCIILWILPRPTGERAMLAGLVAILTSGCAFLWIFLFWATGNSDARALLELLRRDR